MALLDHPSSYVREGAICGISVHLDGATANILKRLAATDPSPAIREVATNALMCWLA